MSQTVQPKRRFSIGPLSITQWPHGVMLSVKERFAWVWDPRWSA